MQYSLIVVLVSAAVLVGCSSEAPTSPASQKPSPSQSSNTTSSGGAESDTVVASPQHDAVIVVNAAKQGEDGPSCTSDMAAQGKSECGPESSLTKLSWEFTEHRDGSDYYKFSWALTSDGEPKDSKGLTVAFDGDTEATVIDAEHYIVIRKGPLSTQPENAK